MITETLWYRKVSVIQDTGSHKTVELESTYLRVPDRNTLAFHVKTLTTVFTNEEYILFDCICSRENEIYNRDEDDYMRCVSIVKDTCS